MEKIDICRKVLSVNNIKPDENGNVSLSVVPTDNLTISDFGTNIIRAVYSTNSELKNNRDGGTLNVGETTDGSNLYKSFENVTSDTAVGVSYGVSGTWKLVDLFLDGTTKSSAVASEAGGTFGVGCTYAIFIRVEKLLN